MTHYDVRILEKLNVLWYPVDLTKEAYDRLGIKGEIIFWCNNNLSNKWRHTWAGRIEFNNKHDKMMFLLRWGEYVL